MFIDLLDALRCPSDHDETWLVARIDRMVGRYIADGSLGCPVCRQEFPVRDFVAYFSEELASVTPVVVRAGTPDDQLTRLAALLDLGAPGGFVGVAGSRAADAAALATAFDVQCVVVNPSPGATSAEGCSVLHCAGRVPLAAGALRALAYDAHVAADERLLASLVRAVRPGGRLLAPASLPHPPGVRELARDETEWVGVSEAPPMIIPLSRGGSGSPVG
jgi:uncharacterized protein YbaR (Trm112 family)